MATYAVTQLHMSRAAAGITAGAVTLVLSLPAILVLIYPAFLLLQASPVLPTLLAVVAVLALLNATGGATVIITLAEIFPAEVRATSMSVVYAWAWRSSAASDSSS